MYWSPVGNFYLELLWFFYLNDITSVSALGRGTMHISLLLLAALLNIACVVQSTGTPGEFDYYVFVRQWGNTLCEDVSCSRKPKCDFTIHGLWPNYYKGYPEECTREEFDEDQIDSLIPQLEIVWPSYMGSNEAFWTHEWEKHGTCTGKSQYKYFRNVLRLEDSYDLLDTFGKYDIVPSASSYATDKLYAALSTEFQAHPYLHFDGDCNLEEVWLCFDTKLKIMDCPLGKSKMVPLNLTPRKMLAETPNSQVLNTANDSNDKCSRVYIPSHGCPRTTDKEQASK